MLQNVPTEELKLFKAMGLPQPSIVASQASTFGGGPDILGGKLKSCPSAVHEDMLLKAAHAVIPITTLEQRARCSLDRVPSTVPSELLQARKWCYVHPKLPPPRGSGWRLRQGVYELKALAK